MKGRHHLKRRFSLQPASFLRDSSTHHERSKSRSESTAGSLDKSGEGGDAASAVSGTRHKLVVMGGAKVGKSSLITQFLYGVFSSKYKRTVEEMHRADFCVQGVQLTLEILDTSGSFEFPAMRDLSISSSEAFVLVYSIADAASFEEARVLRDQIIEIKGSASVPIVVVGNKLDLADTSREVDLDTTESLVTMDWEHGFLEASAKDNVNVTEVFKELLNQAKVKYNLSPALRRRRQSLPTQCGTTSAPPTPGPTPHHPGIPSSLQLQHLQSIQEKQMASGSGSKRNSCVIS
ncbi:unnamed protein product [Bemisia tabaci]|uniref:Small monomeric GTPase n=1 Tax=Bemisia tabaci TaxID=7038 RepID=A0A9P0F7B3_BEMTA|nr:PREDICTED: ras-related protein Rap-1 [Bemisia tabaci]CAH0395044.1 unnamed protein product [Bemisia tabaci]